MSLVGDDPAHGLPPLPLILGIALAFVVSTVLVGIVADSSLAAAAYGGALLTVILTLLLAARMRKADADDTTAQPDWAVTAAAIRNRRRAVVVIDRANRVGTLAAVGALAMAAVGELGF